MPKRSKTRLTVILMILSIMLLCFGLVACGGTKTYKVTLDYDSEQGSVELSPKAEDNKYKEGTELTVTVTPNEGYVLDTFKLSTEDRNATPDNAGKFVFKVEEDTTITVTFKSTTPSVDKYGVAKNTPENGEIEITPAADAEGKYAKDTEITVTLKPAQGYEVDTFTVGGVNKKSELDNNVYKFNITAETEINATFKKSDEEKTTYTVTVSETSNGTITLDPEAEGNKYEENAQVEVTVTPATGYVVDTFTVSTDADAELDGEGKYTLTVTANTTISATFKPEPVAEKYGVTKNTPENGEIEITPAADAEGKYAKDTEITVTLRPAQGYEVDTFTVGGVDKKAELDNNVYKFNITAETEINATFKKSVPAVTAITLNKSSLELVWNYFKEEEEKSVFTLSIASVTPSEISADELEIEWEVGDDTFAEVDANGKITAKATGSTYVTATVKGTDVTAMCTISVTKHEHTLTYAKKDDSQHTATCSVCEYTHDEAHSTHLVSDGESGHHTECEAAGCDYKTETVVHSELVLSSEGEGVDNTYHTMKCPDECGYYVQKQHRWVVQTSATQHWNQCSVCQRESTHTDHKLAYRLSEDGTKHIAYCTDSAVGATSNKCNYVGAEEEHAGSECAVKAEDPTHHYTKCAKCKELFGATEHSGTVIKTKEGDTEHHYTECTACEALFNATAHTPGEEVTTKPEDSEHHYFKCSACQAPCSPTKHSGTVIKTKEGDTEHHYTECTACEALFNATAHTPGEEVTTKPEDSEHHYFKCSACQAPCSPTKHVPGNWVEKDSFVHSVSCTVCQMAMSDENHDTADGGKCSKCGYNPSTLTLKQDVNGYYDGTCTSDACTENHLFTVDASGILTALNLDGHPEVKMIKVPTTIGTQQVVSLGAANKSVFKDNKTVERIIVPEGITGVNSAAFMGCSALKSVVILSSITTVPTKCFSGCAALEWIVLPKSITSVHKYAFGTATEVNATPLEKFTTIYFLGSETAWSAIEKTLGATGTPTITVLGKVNKYYYEEGGDNQWAWEVDGVTPKIGRKEA